MKFSIVIVLLVGKKSLDLSFLLHLYPVYGVLVKSCCFGLFLLTYL